MQTQERKLTKAQQRAQECRNSIEYLQSIIKPGDTINTVLKSCSRSGMYRHIAAIVHDQNISGYVSDAIAQKWHDDGSVGMGGCGMDMGFALVYALSSVLNPQGFVCIGDGCPSNDHCNGDRDYTPHLHSDGGYALRHRWL